MIIDDGFHSKHLLYEFYLIQLRSKNSKSAADESWVFGLRMNIIFLLVENNLILLFLKVKKIPDW